MKTKVYGRTALLLALLLLLSQTALGAGTVSVSSVSGKTGELAAVEVRLTGDDVCSGNFTICFDSDSLQLVSAARADGSWFGYVNETGPGRVRVSFAQTTPLTDALLCVLSFRITANTAPQGSAVTVENLRLYDGDGQTVGGSVQTGAVTRQCAWFHLDSAETVAGQSARVEVSLDGGMLPAGGNFTVNYDPDVLEPTAVLALDGLGGAALDYSLTTPGAVRISYAASEAIPGGRLCAVIFRAVGGAETGAQLTLTDVRAYDENSEPVDTAVTAGSVRVVAATDKAPKLWVVGGALNEDGTATVSVVLQGRGQICGGDFTLKYAGGITVIQTASGVETQAEDGALRVSWASATPALEELTLVTLTLSGGAEGKAVDFGSDVRLYDSGSTQVSVVDIRPGTLTAQGQVSVQMAESTVAATASGTRVTVEVDLADVGLYTDQPLKTVTPILALYADGRLAGLAMEDGAALSGGVAELSLTAKSTAAVTEYKVFLLDAAQSATPLCPALGET
jgi:hypothetical protein